jgi:Flp pilus assembly protein TadD
MAAQPPEDLPSVFFVGSAGDVLARGLACIEAGDHGQAELIIKQLIDARPGHPEACNLRGINAMKGNNAAFVVRCFTEASSLNLPSADYAANLGRALGAEQRWREAARF